MHDQSTKTCNGCGAEWPRTLRFFHANNSKKANKDGLQPRCKACLAGNEARRLVILANFRAPEGSKACSKCLAPLPITSEFFHRRDDGGLRADCKSCVNSRYREYTRDPVKGAEYIRRQKERKKQNWEDNKQYLKKYNKQCVSRARADPIKGSLYRATTRANNAKRRAFNLQSKGSYTREDLGHLYSEQAGLCAYCREPLNGKYEADHKIPLSRGGDNYVTNIALACRPCNRSKGAQTAEEFIALLSA